MNRKLQNIKAGARREASKAAGAYDGRFGHRVFTDQKKEASRMACRSPHATEVREVVWEVVRSNHRM